MRIFGLEITRAKGHVPGPNRVSTIADNRGGWFPWIREPFSGAWQRNAEEWSTDTVLAHHAVYTCITLIASDIGKLRLRLVEQDENGIWRETASGAFSPVLRRPNRYQNHIQFKEWWVTSKLIRGNTYVLKERDNRRVVRALHLLDPDRVQVLVSPDGRVFYSLQPDNLSGLEEADVVPASEIIHDRMNCVFHPLVGVSPIFASGMAANIGLRIQANSASFFGNGSNPSGVLVVPTQISQQQADKLTEQWNEMASRSNSGVVPVLPNGMTFEPLRMSAVDSQMIEHLQWTAETVASTFHIPKFKIGVGDQPTFQNGETLNQIYYSDCLQSHIEQFEACLDEGLGLDEKVEGRQLGVELDLDDLLRMDQATLYKTLGEGVKAAILAPNEARLKVNQAPVAGGNTPYMQQQNYSLAALDARDRAGPAPGSTPTDSSPTPDADTDADARVTAAVELRTQLRKRAWAAQKRRAAWTN